MSEGLIDSGSARLHSTVLLDQPDLAPATRHNGINWVLFAVLGFIAGQIVALIFISVAASITGHSHDLNAITKEAEPPQWFVAAELVGLWVGFAGSAFIASRMKGVGSFTHDLGLRFRPIDMIGLGIGALSQLLVTAIYLPFQHHLKNFNGPSLKLTGSAHGSSEVFVIFLTVVCTPIVEELFFRGLLFRGLLRWFAGDTVPVGTRRTLAVIGSVLLTGVLFGLAHAELEQLAGLAIFGVILSVLAYRTGRLGMNMFAHAGFNAVAIIYIFHTR